MLSSESLDHGMDEADPIDSFNSDGDGAAAAGSQPARQAPRAGKTVLNAALKPKKPV